LTGQKRQEELERGSGVEEERAVGGKEGSKGLMGCKMQDGLGEGVVGVGEERAAGVGSPSWHGCCGEISGA
jgi:hypothetical protein